MIHSFGPWDLNEAGRPDGSRDARCFFWCRGQDLNLHRLLAH